MIRSTILGCFIGVMITLIVSSGYAVSKTTYADVSGKAHDAWETFKDYVADQKHEAVEYAKELLKKADDKIDEMEERAAKASGDTKAEYDKSIKKLKKTRDNASKKLDKLEKASASAWESAKDEFAEAYQDLYDAYKEVADKFK